VAAPKSKIKAKKVSSFKKKNIGKLIQNNGLGTLRSRGRKPNGNFLTGAYTNGKLVQRRSSIRIFNDLIKRHKENLF
jgi:hypothetical protein